MAEAQHAGAIGIAGYAQVAGAADISTKFERVIAPDLGPVVDSLELALVFDQRAVTTADIQAFAPVRS